MEQTENKMGTMPEGKLLMNMSLPMIISMLVQAMYNIVDSIFVAKIEEDALTAVSLAFPLQALLIAIAAGTGVGVNALVSRALGEKNSDKANKTAVNGIFVYGISYLVVAIVSVFVVPLFYSAMTKASEVKIYNYGVDYLSIVMIFSFGIFTQFIFERLLQSTGRTMYTMASQMTGAIINIILDPILIFGYFGMPELGIKGAAIATVIGQIVAGGEAILWNLWKNHDIKISFKGFCPNRSIIANIYKIGFPSIIMQSIGSIMTAGMNVILMDLSKTSAAVFGVYFKLQSFFFMPVFGLNNGLIPILSYNFGAKKKDRMMKTLKYGYMTAFAFTLLGFLAFEIIPELLFMPFEPSKHMLEIGVPALRIIGVHYLIAWFCIVTGTLFQSVGKAVYSMYVSVARQLVVLLPVAYVLAKIGGLSLIWWCFPIAEIMSLAISLVCMNLTFKKVLNQI